MTSAPRIRVGGVAAAAALSLLWVVLQAGPAGGQQAPRYRAPRAADGHPDLNGIWQALNTANYDLEAHLARPAMALRPGPYGPVPAAPVLALGAVGAVPGGMGVTTDGAIPYKPEALPGEKKTRRNGSSATRRSSATSRECRARPTCRIHFRSFKASPPSSSPTSTPVRCEISI